MGINKEIIDSFEKLYVGLNKTVLNQLDIFWGDLFNNYVIDEKFVLDNLNTFDKDFIDNIGKYQKLSEDFILKLIEENKISKSIIITCQNLSLSFIDEHGYKLHDIYKLSGHQKLSEDFINRYADKVNWAYIREYENLSKEFRIKYQKRLCPTNPVNKNYVFGRDGDLNSKPINWKWFLNTSLKIDE